MMAKQAWCAVLGLSELSALILAKKVLIDNARLKNPIKMRQIWV